MFEDQVAIHGSSQQEKEDENYFVSMTDMLVGMLFLFVIMLMAFAINYKSAQDTSDLQREEINETIERISEEVDTMQQADNQRSLLLHQLEQRLRVAGVKVKVDEANGVLRLPDDILFPFGSAKLSLQGRVALGHLARAMAAILPCYANVPSDLRPENCRNNQDFHLEAVFIEGHTDADGPPDVNWRLSADRAIATYKALEEASSSLVRLENLADQRLLSVSGYAFYRNIVPNDTAENKALNRRIDLRFIMQISHEQSLRRIQDQLRRIIKP